MTGSESSSTSWFDENVGRPAANSLKESANAGLNLVNLALSPTGAELPKFTVQQGEQTAVGAVVSGLVSAVPYALAGGAVGKLSRLLPATERVGLLSNSSLHQIAGAGLLDGFRDLRPGETTAGNIAGSVAGFSVYEFGNARLKGMSFLGAAAGRLAVGASGGIAQSAFSDLGSLRTPEIGKFNEAGITGGGMNLLLPTVQHLVARSLRLNVPNHAAPDHAVPDNAVPVRPEPAPMVPAGDLQGGSAAKPPAPSPLRTEPKTPFDPTSRLDPESYSAFSVLGKYSEKLRRDEQQLLSMDGSDYATPTYTLRTMEKIAEARSNMSLIAKGQLPAEVTSAIERGWFPPNTVELLRTKLHTDLLNARQYGESGSNVADIASQSPSAAGFQGKAMENLAQQYLGSPTRLVLRALDKDSLTLGDMYDTVAGARINRGRAQTEGITIDPGMSPETMRFVETTQTAIQGIEKSLANPVTREATLAELNAQRMHSEPLIQKFAAIERAESRAAGPVELKKFPAWNEAYRLLARVEREQLDPPRYPMSVRESTSWMARALGNMEEIATGKFEPHIQAMFDQKPELLNRMRADLEKNLKENQRQSATTFQKENTQSLTYAYRNLFSPYERSSMYRLLEEQGQVPQQLNRMYSLAKMMDPFTERHRVQQGLDAIYALERGLLDPALSDNVRKSVESRRVGIMDRQLISEFSSMFADLYAHQNVATAPTDYSNVVKWTPKAK
jgi:hypothetical protein